MLNNELLKNTIEEALKLGVQKVEQRNDPKIGHTYGAHIRSLASVKTDTDEPLNMVMDALFAQRDMHSLIGSIPNSMPTTEFSLYGDGSVSIAAHWVANWLLAKSLSLPGGTEDAVNKLSDFISTKSVKGIRVVVVAGVSVPDIIQLNGGIAVYPIEYLPPALGRDSLFAFCKELRYYLPRAERSPYPALTAVVKGFDMAPAVFSPPSHSPDWATRIHEDFDYLISIASAFSLLDETRPQVVARWACTAEPDSIPGLTGGTSGDADIASHLQKRYIRIKSSKATQVTQTLNSFIDFAEHQKLELPLERLSMFRTKRDFRDNALDLGIAMESFFFGGGDDKNDLSHKVAARGAIYGSEKVDSRADNYRLIKTAYKVRSHVIHGKRVNPDTIVRGGLRLTGSEVLDQTSELLLRCIKTALEAGHMPDWPKVDLDIN